MDVVVAENSTPMRQLVVSYLSALPHVQVQVAVSNGKELLETVAQKRPTAVFLNVEMPEMDGLSVAAILRQRYPNIFIVFITAHTKYAVEAFQLDAVDYLVKPITRDAVVKSVRKIDKFLNLQRDNSNDKYNDCITIKNNHDMYFIHLKDIIFVEKEIRKTRFHTEKGQYLATESLGTLEQKLSKGFFRCHKSYIINLNKIEKIAPIADRIYRINFYNYPHTATMGRPKFEELSKIMAQLH